MEATQPASEQSRDPAPTAAHQFLRGIPRTLSKVLGTRIPPPLTISPIFFKLCLSALHPSRHRCAIQSKSRATKGRKQTTKNHNNDTTPTHTPQAGATPGRVDPANKPLCLDSPPRSLPWPDVPPYHGRPPSDEDGGGSSSSSSGSNDKGPEKNPETSVAHRHRQHRYHASASK